MLRAAFVVAAVFFGMSWILGAPYPADEKWRVLAGWILLAWAAFNIPAFVKGSKGWAKLFLALLLIALGMGAVNGNWTLLEGLF